MENLILALLLLLAILILAGVIANAIVLVRLSRRMLLDKDVVVEQLHAKLEDALKSDGDNKAKLAEMENQIAILKRRMAKYPSLFLKRRVYWHADPEVDGRDKDVAFCPLCWNDNHLLSPIDRNSKTYSNQIGACSKHAPPAQF